MHWSDVRPTMQNQDDDGILMSSEPEHRKVKCCTELISQHEPEEDLGFKTNPRGLHFAPGPQCILMKDDTVEYAMVELIALDIGECTFAPKDSGRFWTSEAGADIGVFEAALQCVGDGVILWAGALWQQPFDLLKGVVHACAEVAGLLFQVEGLTGIVLEIFCRGWASEL